MHRARRSSATDQVPRSSHDSDEQISLDDLEAALDADMDVPLIVREDDKGSEPNRRLVLGRRPRKRKFCSNFVSNAKYNFVTFFPVCLYNQFKFFFNLYFLLVALSQMFPPLRIGYLSAYILPLAFVLSITLGKEALDDLARRKRDNEANATFYRILGQSQQKAKHITVGDIIILNKNMRVPADCVLLKSEDGEAFIRTDQLDGETDWKLKTACILTQKLEADDLLDGSTFIDCPAPKKDLHSFTGAATRGNSTVALSVDNTLWANTVLASGSAICLVVYTGKETRQALNSRDPRNKNGILEMEINRISKILCLITFALSFFLVFHSGFTHNWWISLARFLILFSTIIPVSLRVNLDLGKLHYSSVMERDQDLPGLTVRSTTIPEDLGRIKFLLSDKTGTLTRNEMEMRKLHIGSMLFSNDDMDDLTTYFEELENANSMRSIGQRTKDVIWALSICHNVTPIIEESDGEQSVSYQASSPDEVAIVKWTKKVGLQLIYRDKSKILLKHKNETEEVKILHVFPFTSESKRMSIVVRLKGTIYFIQKGADMVMKNFVVKTDWLEEECGNLAREGLRTLVIARKKLSEEQYSKFCSELNQANIQLHSRDIAINKVVSQYLENGLETLGITGVEDILQADVKPSLELLKNAGIGVWMLTGDKTETARCIAISSRLFNRNQPVCMIENCDIETAWSKFSRIEPSTNLVIEGASLQTLIQRDARQFCRIACSIPAIVACRCTPKQKEIVANTLKLFSHKRVCCIGDGGNDVSMIQAADVGIGIQGKEGMQASLAADYSITQFRHVTKLLLWHGRNSYRNSCKLVHLIIHRGFLIAICQVVFSIASKFEPKALYQGWLMVGYATIYTMMPIFSLVLDRDITVDIAYLYPELYRELEKGKQLNLLTFTIYLLLSVYQGVVIFILTMFLVGIHNFKRAIMVSFTALIFTELCLVASVVTRWNLVIAATELVSITLYIATIPFLGDYFDLKYAISGPDFYWKMLVITTASVLPPLMIKFINRRLNPPSYAKLQF